MSLTKATYSMIKGAPVNVLDYISGGTGTSGDPYVGWDTATPWAANTEFKFPKGVFQYSTTLSLPYAYIYIHGVGVGTTLKFTGTGNCISFDSVSGINSPRIESLCIDGNANATNGIYTNNANYGVCKDVTIRNVSGAGFRSLFGVYWLIQNFYMGSNFGAITTYASAGIYLGLGGSASSTVTAYTIINANIAECINSGIDINNGWGNTIIGGAVEANQQQGLFINTNAHDNLINNLYIEGNLVYAILCGGTGNDFIGVWCAGNSFDSPFKLTSTTTVNHIFGGVYEKIIIDAGAFANGFTNSRCGIFNDSGNGTTVDNLFSAATAAYVHPTFVSSWTNNVTNPYETFTSSGSSITSAINTTGVGIANSNSFYLVGGATYIFQWFVTLNSGTLPGFVVSSNTATSATGVSVVGNNMYMITAGSSDNYYFTLRTESGIASNFACTQINVKQIN